MRSQSGDQILAKCVFRRVDETFETPIELTTLDCPVVEEDILRVPGIGAIGIDCEPLVVACRVHIDV